MQPPFPGLQLALFGMGCFWGAEKKYWEAEGVHTPAVGYSAGFTPNPTYAEVCSGRTGHNEVVQVVFDPTKTSYDAVLRGFWENHDPTQGMRQGNDVGTQYRSAIYHYSEEQAARARVSRVAFQGVLRERSFGEITTEIEDAPDYFFAEHYHQQYLAKNPNGYFGMGGPGALLPNA